MKIAVIGSGNVGKALGEVWKNVGHQISYGVRHPVGETDKVSVAEAVRAAEIVVLAVPWSAVADVISDATLFSGKILIDCTNPINSTFSGLTLGHDDSAGETIQRLLPEAKVVKAFNTCGANVMGNPSFPEGSTSMFVASDDEEAKKVVLQLSREMGFDPVDCGPLFQSRYLESTAWLWISVAMKYGAGREIGFRLMRR